MKVNVRLLCRTALLLALCIASQFLKNTSVYITGSLVNTILILATLSCGFLSGTAISVIAPLTAWWITGAPLISAMPLLLPCIMLGNVLLVAFVWVFARVIRRKFKAMPRMTTDDSRFRVTLLVAAVACALWGSVCIVFLSTMGDFFALSTVAPMIVSVLVAVGGAFLLFTALWMLVARFPDTWSLIAGMVFGSVFKTIVMWLTIVQGVLPAFGPDSGLKEAALDTAAVTYSITQLLTALLGAALALLIWLPLKKFLDKPTE